MNWIALKDEQELKSIQEKSHVKPVVIFKHSTRCSISSTAFNRLQRTWDNTEVNGAEIYYLDLLSFRNISNQIEEVFNVEHQSPQVLLIKDGKCVYHTSHLNITFEGIKKYLVQNGNN